MRLSCLEVRSRMPVLMRTLFVIVLLLLPAALFAQNPAEDDEGDAAQKEATKGFEFKFKDRPSFRYGENLRMDIKSKWHLDFRRFYPVAARVPDLDETFSLTRARFGLKGKVTKFFDYEVEREMRGTFGELAPRHPWKDVYVDFQPSEFLEFKVGKFK